MVKHSLLIGKVRKPGYPGASQSTYLANTPVRDMPPTPTAILQQRYPACLPAHNVIVAARYMFFVLQKLVFERIITSFKILDKVLQET